MPVGAVPEEHPLHVRITVWGDCGKKNKRKPSEPAHISSFGPDTNTRTNEACRAHAYLRRTGLAQTSAITRAHERGPRITSSVRGLSNLSWKVSMLAPRLFIHHWRNQCGSLSCSVVGPSSSILRLWRHSWTTRCLLVAAPVSM